MYLSLLILGLCIYTVTMTVFLGYFVYMIDMVFGGHDFPTTPKGRGQVGKILVKFNKQNGVLYDLGSCRGNF